jgi:hypothetical protein
MTKKSVQTETVVTKASDTLHVLRTNLVALAAMIDHCYELRESNLNESTLEDQAAMLVFSGEQIRRVAQEVADVGEQLAAGINS